MQGWIYRIYDTRNGISYIGQTINIKKRMRQHLYSICKEEYNSKLYEYLRSIPKECIGFEIICECDSTDLDLLEAYYIQVYDAYENGLNTASVSSVFRHKEIYDKYNKIYQDWLSGKSYIDIAEDTKLSVTHISNIINSLRKPGDIPAKSVIKHTNKAKPIVCYDKSFNFLFKFDSISDAVKYLKLNYNNSLSNYSAYVHIKQSALNGNIAYGFRWQYRDDLYYEGKVFNTKWDIEAYKNGGSLVKNRFGLHECLNDTVQDARKKDEIMINKGDAVRVCEKCKKILSKKTVGTLCNECINHNNYKEKQVPPDIHISYPFVKEELAQLYPKYTVLSIANHCNVSFTTVNKWLKKFGLK